MPAQLLTVALERTSTRQCALPRSGFVLGRDPAVQQPEAELRQTTISRHSVQALTSPRNRRKSTLTTSFSLGTDGTLVGR
jgi:hypothetical protein